MLAIGIVSSGIVCGVLCCRNQVSYKSHPQNMMECNYWSILVIAIVSSGIGCGVLCCRNQVSDKSHPENMMECNYQSILVIAIVSSGIGCGVLCCRNQVSDKSHPENMMERTVTINPCSPLELCRRVSAVDCSAVVTKRVITFTQMMECNLLIHARHCHCVVGYRLWRLCCRNQESNKLHSHKWWNVTINPCSSLPLCHRVSAVACSASMRIVKVRGQRSRSQRSQPNLTVSGL